MRRFKAKDNGVIMTNDFAICITLHKNQVWYGKQVEKDTWEIKRDNVSIKMQEDMLRKNFKEDIEKGY